MPFTLHVEFSGLCLFVTHPDETRNEVAVLMPDARDDRGPMQPPIREQHDGTPAVPHAGYLRVDLANVSLKDATLPSAEDRGPDDEDTSPFFEVVYRFAGHTLDFGLSSVATPPIAQWESTGKQYRTALPDLTELAPTSIALRPDVFTPNVTSPLLFRTVLHGGALYPSGTTPGGPLPDVDRWSIANLPDDPEEHAPQIVIRRYYGETVWTRTVSDADGMTLTLTPLDGGAPVRLPLKPVDSADGPVIRLKIANLCSVNPLEWKELPLHDVATEDADFKWVFHLFDPVATPGDWTTVLGRYFLPAPRLMASHPQLHGTTGDCVGATVSARFAPIASWR